MNEAATHLSATCSSLEEALSRAQTTTLSFDEKRRLSIWLRDHWRIHYGRYVFLRLVA